MILPTAAEIREWSRVDFDEFDFAEDAPDPLDLEISRANAYVEMVTGRFIEDLDGVDELSVMWNQVVQMRVEQNIVWRQNDYVTDQNEDVLDFKVTGYAQTRIRPDVRKGKAMINGWDDLNMGLINLMTDDKLDYWQELGMIPSDDSVAFQGLIEPDWDVDPWV